MPTATYLAPPLPLSINDDIVIIVINKTISSRHSTPYYVSHLYLILSMAPIRRYLRITKYSVLECRIYLDNPALAHSWLLNPRNSILPKVIEAVRPLVLPKLREERERAQSKKKSKKRSIKDVVIEGMSGYYPVEHHNHMPPWSVALWQMCTACRLTSP